MFNAKNLQFPVVVFFELRIETTYTGIDNFDVTAGIVKFADTFL